ncbi:hypothetical protein A9R05_22190 [Burkholderia sp. KK1]|nr:hypothetical protein A9R05_22190 [Burkholderia sp. KK1]
MNRTIARAKPADFRWMTCHVAVQPMSAGREPKCSHGLYPEHEALFDVQYVEQVQGGGPSVLKMVGLWAMLGRIHHLEYEVVIAHGRPERLLLGVAWTASLKNSALDIANVA